MKEALAPQGTGGYAGALARGEARLFTWMLDGTLVPQAAIAEELSYIDTGAWAFRLRNELWCPAVLLDFRRPTLSAISQALAGVDPASRLIFLLREHDTLRGRTSTDKQGDQSQEVIRLAQLWGRNERRNAGLIYLCKV